MLPSILAKEIIKGLQAYVVTGFETPTPFFKGIFSDLVKTPGRFYKGPYLGLQLPFQSGEAGKDFFTGLTTEHAPWLHQQQAWQRLASDRDAASTRCQPWKAKRRLVDPSSREAALFSRRALRQRENKVGLRTRRPVIGRQVRSSKELAKLLRSAG